MGLTWDEFLKLATIITNLDDSIYYYAHQTIIKAAAKEYREFFNDLKYMHFMNEVRISFINVIINFQLE